MKKLIYLPIFLLVIFSCNKDEETSIAPTSDTPEGYKLVWADEFDDSNISTSNWVYETGDGTDYGLPIGWGNNERQIYTTAAENSSIKSEDGNSVLAITALSDGNGGFTSAKLTTKNKMTMRFGRIDVKAKMPKGQGLWPAIWMLGYNIDEISWPGCGEIDLVEILGHEPSTLYSTIHYTNSEKKHGQVQNIFNSSSSLSDGFHVYTLDWSPQSLTFSLDGTELRQMQIEGDMKEYLRHFYLILNVAVGGNWAGDPDEATSFPQSMYVDYVRVYSKDGMQIPAAPILDIDEETVGQVIEPNIGDHAVKDGFNEFGELSVITYGPGEPFVSTSDSAINGNLSLVFDFPGGDWGGGYLELSENKDLSSFSTLNFSVFKSENLQNAEIKLESTATNFVVFLADYNGTDAGEGFIEYNIPLSDFTELDLTDLKIPFSMWNPQDVSETIIPARVLIDNIYFSN